MDGKCRPLPGLPGARILSCLPHQRRKARVGGGGDARSQVSHPGSSGIRCGGHATPGPGWAGRLTREVPTALIQVGSVEDAPGPDLAGVQAGGGWEVGELGREFADRKRPGRDAPGSAERKPDPRLGASSQRAALTSAGHLARGFATLPQANCLTSLCQRVLPNFVFNIILL